MSTDALIAELLDRGVLDSIGADWALARQAECGGPLTHALLELDLIDEEELARGLAVAAGLPAASLADIAGAEASAGEWLPPGSAVAFRLCPIAADPRAVAMAVEEPLSPEELRELRELVGGSELILRVAAPHWVELARAAVYGSPIDERTRRLELRLGRRRAVDVRRAVDALARADGVRSACEVVLAFAAELVEYSAFMAPRGDGLRVLADRGPLALAGNTFALPDAHSPLVASVRHGGFYLGAVGGNDGAGDAGSDAEFYRGLGRPVPACAFVAPVAIAGGARGLFYADNGARGLAKRRVAELTLLTARFSQRAADWADPQVAWKSWAAAAESALESALDDRPGEPQPAQPAGSDAEPTAEAEPAAEPDPVAADPRAAYPIPVPIPIAPSAPYLAAPDAARAMRVSDAPIAGGTATDTAGSNGASRANPARPDDSRQERDTRDSITPGERRVLAALNAAALAAGRPVDEFTDALLRERASADAAALAGEVKGLFEKLATDIPAQLARGMESAFRDMMPRLAAAPAVPMAARPIAAAPSAAAVASLQLVQTDPAEREVPDYRSRRRKAKRVKL